MSGRRPRRLWRGFIGLSGASAERERNHGQGGERAQHTIGKHGILSRVLGNFRAHDGAPGLRESNARWMEYIEGERMDPRNHDSGKPMAANRKRRVYFSCSYRGHGNAVTPNTNAIGHFLERAAGLFLNRDGRLRCRGASRRHCAIVVRHDRTRACHIALRYEDAQCDQKQQQDVAMRPQGRIARRSG